MATDESRVFTAVGKLQAQVSTLSDRLGELQQTSTAEHRKVHDIIDALSEAVRNLTRVVDEMKPLTEDYREKRAEARGAARLAGWLYTAAGVIGGVAVFLLGKIGEWLAMRPHP